MRAEKLRRRASLPRGARLIAVSACIGLIAGVGLRNLAYYPLHVTSNSMFPTVAAGDWVVVSPHQAAAKAAIQRGDIVLFRFPFGGDGRAIKRVVAIAGDRVTAEQNQVRVNGAKANYGSKIPNTDEKPVGLANEATVVPEGFYYILGDNIASSVDSRSLGLLPQTEVLGRVAAAIKGPW
jgi:signal peptidase I